MNYPDFPFVDLAVGGVNRRNNPVPVQEVRSRVNGSGDSYTTIHRFPDAFRQHVETTGSVRGWDGPSWADYLVFDIDIEGDLEEARRATIALVWLLLDSYGVKPDQVRVFFSGKKGFHVLVPTDLLGPLVPSPQLAPLLKDLALAIAHQAEVSVDTSIYDRTRLFRLPNTRHSGSGLFKIELPWDELVRMDASAIRDLASSPRDFTWKPDQLEPVPALEALLERVAEREPASLIEQSTPPAGDGLPDDVEALLAAVPAGVVHEDWLRVGMALHHADKDAGLRFWDTWSATCPEKYPGPEEIRRRWASFDVEERTRTGGKITTIGTLRHMAMERGYRPAPKPEQEQEPAPKQEAEEEMDGEAPERKVPAPMSMAELLAMEEPEERYHVEGLIEHDTNVLLAAAPKSHKTNLMLHLAVTGCAGRSVLGAFPVPEALRVGLVLMEDRPHRIRRRIERLAKSEGIEPHALEGRLFTWFRPPLRLTDPIAIRDLGDYVEQYDLDVLAVDSYSYVSVGDSNSADEVTPQLMGLSALRDRRPGLCVILVVHAGKHQENRGDRVTDIIRGSGAFGAWFDTGILLTRKDEHAPVTIRVEHRDLPAPDPFAFTVEDEFPGTPPSGFLRLRRSEKSADQLLREKHGEKLAPELKARLKDYPDGVSRRELRGLLDAPRRDVEAAFEVLRSRGEAELKPSPGPGRASRYSLTVPGVP